MITELIDKALAQKEDRVRSGKYSPSSLGKCYRAQFWNRKNFPISDPIDERTLRVFKAGSIFHEFIQGIILKDNPEAQKEVLVETEDFKGFADLVIGDEVIDLKTQHSKAFWYRKDMAWKELVPKLKCNILQVVFYAVQLKKNNARLVFISKDDLSIQEYPIKVDEFREELAIEVTKLNGYWKEDKLPKAIPRAYPDNKGEFAECSFCNWRTICKEMK